MTRSDQEESATQKRYQDQHSKITQLMKEAGGTPEDWEEFLDGPQARQLGLLVMGKVEFARPCIWRRMRFCGSLIRKSAFSTNYDAYQYINPIEEANGVCNIDLVLISGSYMGFSSRVTLDKIYEAALSRGLLPCPPEIVQVIHEYFNDQTTYERLNVATEVFIDSDGNRKRGGCLINDRAGKRFNFFPEDLNPGVWDPSNRWIFIRPHKLIL